MEEHIGFESKGSLTIPRRALEVLGAASEIDDSERYPLHAAGFMPDGSVVATDGWLWLRARSAACSLAKPIVLEAEAVLDVARLSEDGTVKIELADDGTARVEMESGGLSCAASVMAETRPFPNTEKTIPADKPLVTVDVQVSLFLRLFRILSKLDAGVVRLQFVSDERPIRILAWSGQTPIDGCVMPMKANSLGTKAPLVQPA